MVPGCVDVINGSASCQHSSVDLPSHAEIAVRLRRGCPVTDDNWSVDLLSHAKLGLILRGDCVVTDDNAKRWNINIAKK